MGKSENDRSKSFAPRLIVGSSLLAVAVVAGIVWLLGSAMSESREAAFRHKRVRKASGPIPVLDNLVTMTVETCVITGNMQWESAYDKRAKKLDHSIGQLDQLTLTTGQKPPGDVSGTRARLAEMEREILNLVEQGKPDEALDLLKSKEHKARRNEFGKAVRDCRKALTDDMTAFNARSASRSRRTVALAVVAACLVLITSIVSLRTLRRYLLARERAEDALREAHDGLEQRVERRTADLARTNAKLAKEHKILNGLLESSDRELRLIAYELHDGLAQLLTGTMMRCEMNQQLSGSQPDEAAEACRTGREMLGKCLEESRRLIRRVRLPLLDESGVITAIEDLVQEEQGHAKLEVEFHRQTTFGRLEPVLENAIYRIVQEGLTNARHHSQSDRVRVELTQDDGHLKIEIEDWGVGFDPDATREKSFGLAGIRERARVLGGKVTIQSEPGDGTRINVLLPLVLPEVDV